MRKGSLIFLIKLSISGLILTVVFQHTDFGQVTARLDSMNVGLLVAAAACLAIQAIVITAWRWSAVLRLIYQAVALTHLVQIVVIGIFFNQVLPSTVGGDGVRIWLLSRGDAPMEVSVRSVVLDRILGLSALFMLGLPASLMIVTWFDGGQGMLGVGILSAIGLALVASVPLFLRLFGKIPWARFQGFLDYLVRQTESLWADKIQFGRLILLSVFGHLVTCLAVWLTARAFGIEIPIGPTIAVIPPILLGAALPISIAGWGVREGGMILGLGLLGVSSSDAALVSVAIGLIGVAMGGFGGLVWLLSGVRGSRPDNRPS